MKVVVDTNVIISGIFWSGVPGRVLEAWAAGLFTLCVSSDIIDEYFEVIDRVGEKCRCPELSRRWKAYIFEHCQLIEKVVEYDSCRDPDDAKFVECALSAGAVCIVSGDEDLLTIGTVEDVEIIKAADLLIKLGL